MTSFELFQEGKLSEAIAQQTRLVAEQPATADRRLLLCELMLFQGELDSVRRHLDLLSFDKPGFEDWRRDYHLLLDAEEHRQKLSSQGEPLFLLPPTPHVGYRLEALDRLRTGLSEEAIDFLDAAEAEMPRLTGHIDGREFDGVRDGDELMAGVLEMFLDGQYLWFPFEQIGKLRLGPREALRDRLFVPATLHARSGEEWNVYLPSLYMGSYRHDDEDIRTGQATDWFADADGPTRGIGLRVLTFGEEELTLLDVTQWEAE